MTRLTKNLVIIVSSLWNRCSIKKNIGERSHWHELPLPPVCILQILMDPIPLSAKIINEYPPLLHWHEVSFAYLILITVLYLIWSKGHQEPRNEVGSGPGDIQLLRYHKMVKIWTPPPCFHLSHFRNPTLSCKRSKL